MQVALQLFLFVGGLAVALFASGRAVEYARALAAALHAPAFVVGVALVGVGTDLPEIANAVVAHLEGEGDVNVGTAVGSALTQYTFVLGLGPVFFAAAAIARREVWVVSLCTMIGLTATAAFTADGRLTRWEGLVMVVAWAVFLAVVVRTAPGLLGDEPPVVRREGKLAQAAALLIALGLVGFGATVAVRSLVRLAELGGVPEFFIAFFGASIGTSAPELVVVLAAFARGAPAIAFGDAFGSSLSDSTLTIGVGGLTAPADVTARTAIVGTLYSVVAVALVAGLLSARRRHDRLSGFLLVGIYALSYVVLIGLR